MSWPFNTMTPEEIAAKVQEIKNIREGMSWGTEEHGIPQLTENEQFLLWLLERVVLEADTLWPNLQNS
jgi:hypothetical protein